MTPRSPFRKLVVTALAALTLGAASSQAFALDTARIMNVFKFPNNWAHHRLLMSHRGIIGDGCPENSTCSIQNVLNSGVVEAIELDVKAASDGGLWLMHDQNLGRMLGADFNMYAGSGWNPDISTIASSQMTNWKLKDRNFKFTNYYIKTLITGLQQTAGIVTVLDLKTHSAAITASVIARQLGVQNRVILKVSSGWHAGTPSQVGSQFGGVPFAITLYANDLDNIVDAYSPVVCGTSCATSKPIVSWVNAAIASNGSGFMFLELGNKNLNTSSDPLQPFVQLWSGSAVSTSQFVPVPEYPANASDPQQGYVRSNSTCCASLSNYLTKTRYFGSETIDNRPYLFTSGQYTTFNSLLTDNVISAHNLLKQQGYRHMEYYN